MPPAPERLRPGLHVVRRDTGQVQIGLDPPQRVIVSADPGSLELLERLRHGASLEALGPLNPAQQRVLRDLQRADLLVDAHGRPGPPGPQEAPGAQGEQDRPQRRSPGLVAGVVVLHDLGLPDGVAALRHLLREAGVEVASSQDGEVADLVVACAAGPLPRATVDPWLADGTPHLVICGTGHPGSLRVGPLVEPGVTACLRCIDAAESVSDPRRQLIVEQLAVRTAAPLDPLTLSLAMAWAARDVRSFLAGAVATTWSSTVDVTQAHPTAQRWQRHPDCGCCWDELPY